VTVRYRVLGHRDLVSHGRPLVVAHEDIDVTVDEISGGGGGGVGAGVVCV
jgi:hypothetical protein